MPSTAVTPTGRDIPFPVLFYCVDDLYHHRYISLAEWHTLHEWIMSYHDGLAMPGDTRFRSPYTNQMVFFPQLLDDLAELFHAATNWDDLTTQEEEAEDPTGVEDIDLFLPYPKNIGRYARIPLQELEIMDMNVIF